MLGLRRLALARTEPIIARYYGTTSVQLGRHDGASSWERHQKERRRTKPRKMRAPNEDRQGKLHGEPGLRIKEKIELAHDLEATLSSNRIPAMWNHPFYLDLYQQIMEPNAPPEVEGSQESLRAIDPDDLHLELLEAASEASRSSGASALGDDSPVQLIGDSASGSPLEDSIKSLSARDFIGGKKNGAAMGLVNKLVDDLKVSDGVGASDALGLIAAPAKAISDSESFGDALAHDSLSIEAPPREDWMQLIRVFGAHGRASDAIRIAEKTEKDFGVLRDEDMYATLIVACGDSKDANLAEAMFDEMQFNGIVPTEHSWSALVHAHVRCGRMDSAFLLMERMAQAGAKPPLAAYTSLLVGIYENSPRDQMFEQAMEVWWNLKYSGAVPSLLSYTAMIRCCTRSREIERALGLIEEMRQEGVRPSVVTYNSLLRGSAIAPQWHRAVGLLTDDILDKMAGDEIPPDVGTFTALIRSCAAVGDVVNARVYFNELEKHGLEHTSETYAALISALAASQAMTHENHKKRYLTQPRGWPVIPNLGLPDPNTPDHKVERLEWDMMGVEKGEKFKGFFNDVEERALEDYKRLHGIKDADGEDGNDEDEHYLTAGEAFDSHGDELAVELSGAGRSLLSDSDLIAMDDDSEVAEYDSESKQGLSWRQTIEQQRAEAALIIAKGEKKRLARENSTDLGDGLQEEKTGRKTKGEHRLKQEFGYKGARSLEEEWGILVKEVYEEVKDDPRTDPGSLERLKEEYSQLAESIERFEMARIEAAREEEEALLSPPPDDADSETSTDVAVIPPSISDLAVKAAPLTEEERMIPWITTEECLDFDWDAADANAPPVGTRYRALPRVAERAEEAKQFCSLAVTSERQESNFRESEALFNELKAKGLPVTADIMNGMLAVQSKALKYDSARDFLATQFDEHGVSPNAQTYRHLVEMYIRGNQLDNAMELNNEMTQTTVLPPDAEVFGAIIRKLADKNRIQEALALFDEATDNGLQIRERNIRELRRRLVWDNLPVPSRIGPDPEQWRADAARVRRQPKKGDIAKARYIQSVSSGR